MTSEVGRRMFVGTITAGLPLLAGAGSTVLADSRLAESKLAQSSHPAGHASAQTPMDRELLRQVHYAVNGLRGDNAAQAARRLAITLRLGAAHYETTGADDAFKQALLGATRREGRDAVLARATDRTRFSREVKEYGISSLPPQTLDKKEQGLVLDRLIAGGISPVLLTLAAHVEGLADHLERRPVVAVSAAAARCADISRYLQLMEIAAMASCFWNPLACAVFSGFYAGTTLANLGVSWYYGCT